MHNRLSDACYFPLLKVVARSRVSRIEAANLVASELGLSEADKQVRTKGGTEFRYVDATKWAAGHMQKAGLLIYPTRGHLVATEESRRFLSAHPGGFKQKDLLKIEQYVRWRKEKKKPAIDDPKPGPDNPDGRIRDRADELRGLISRGLLDRIAAKPPKFLGNVVTELLLKVGHDRITLDPVKKFRKIGRHTHEGIFVLRDPFGSERICLRTNQPRPPTLLGDDDVCGFAGSVKVHHASRGVFVTTSEFTSHARSSVEQIDSRIDLVDGAALATLMMDLNVGCRGRQRPAIPEIDEDYFLRP